MTLVARWCVLGVLLAIGLPSKQIVAQDSVATARKAIGGERLLLGVRTFQFTGRKLIRNQVLGSGERIGEEFVASPMSIKAEFPAKYLQVVDLAFGSARRRFESGFNGLSLLNRTVGARSAQTSSPDALVTQQTEFARLALLIFMRADTALPLTRRQTTGNGDVAWTTGNGQDIILSFDRQSGLPLRATYQVAMRNRDGSRSSELRETILDIRERRIVDGLNLPARIVLIQGGEIMEDLRFESIDLNLVFAPETFVRVAGQLLGGQ